MQANLKTFRLATNSPVAMPSRSDITLQNFAVQSSFSSPGPTQEKQLSYINIYLYM